jgi:hypothetical protein
VLAKHFPVGATSEDLRIRFEKDAFLGRQSFFNALRYAKQQGWLVGGGWRDQLYNLNSDGSWREPPVSIGDELERAKRETTRLECVAGSQAEQIEALEGEVQSLRDFASGTNGVAVEHLTKIISDSTTTVRQKLRAAAVVLGYKVDSNIAEFVKAFLERLCMSPDTPTDYKIEAGEILRRAEGSPRIAPAIERSSPPARDIDPEKEKAEREATSLRRRQHLERQAALDAAELKAELQRLGMSVPISNEP